MPHSYPNAPARRDAMVTAWWNDRGHSGESVMLAYRRSDIAALNRLARERMTTAGLLTGPALTIPDADQDFTFQAGDQVLHLSRAFSPAVKPGVCQQGPAYNAGLSLRFLSD
jgi:hypothetical protein